MPHPVINRILRTSESLHEAYRTRDFDLGRTVLVEQLGPALDDAYETPDEDLSDGEREVVQQALLGTLALAASMSVLPDGSNKGFVTRGIKAMLGTS